MLITLNSKFQILITFYPTFGFRIFFVDIIQLVNLYTSNDSDSGYVNQLRPYRGYKFSQFSKKQRYFAYGGKIDRDFDLRFDCPNSSLIAIIESAMLFNIFLRSLNEIGGSRPFSTKSGLVTLTIGKITLLFRKLRKFRKFENPRLARGAPRRAY